MKHLKLFENFQELEEKKNSKAITSMDVLRVTDIIKKAGGDWNAKAEQLATRMAKAITDGYKAIRRALAAESEDYPDMAKIFFDRAKALDVTIGDALEEVPVKNAEPVAEPPKAEVTAEPVATPDEIDVSTIPYKEKPGHKKLFWKDRYNARLDDDKKEILNDILGSNEALWALARKGIEFDSIKQEDVESKFDNEKPGYIGRFSGDLSVQYKGSVELGYPGKTYYKVYTKRYDTRGFW